MQGWGHENPTTGRWNENNKRENEISNAGNIKAGNDFDGSAVFSALHTPTADDCSALMKSANQRAYSIVCCLLTATPVFSRVDT